MASRILLSHQNIEKQFFVEAGNDMRILLNPLQRRYGITHFSNVRGYADGTKTILTSHPGFTILFFQEKFYQYAFSAKPSEYREGVVLFQDLVDHAKNQGGVKNIVQAASQNQLFRPDLLFVETATDYVDFFFFGVDHQRIYTPTFYLTHLDVFSRYIDFFKKHAQCLLKKSHRSRLVYEGQGNDCTPLVEKEFHSQLIDPCSSRAMLLDQAKYFGFTKKELLVASCLCDGLSPQEIALTLNNSPRTIEKHVLGLRKKTGSRSTIHLISILNKSNWWGG